jgi:CheY-like chemotaxis protein
MRRTVLVVEDEGDIRELVPVSLERRGGFRVLTAESGQVALRIAVEERPDAILLDVMMPGLDGPATLGRLRETPETAGIPVVFLTAKVQSGDRRRLMDLGAEGLIPKPFDPIALPGQLAAALGWSGP